MTLRFRLQLGLLLVVALGFSVLLDRLVADVRPGQRRTIEDPLVDASEMLAALASASARGDQIDTELFRRTFKQVGERKFLAQIYDWEKTNVDTIVYITDAKGRVIFDSRGSGEVGKDYSKRRDVHLTLQGKYGARTSHDQVDSQATSVMYVAAPILVGGRIVGVLSLGKPSLSVNRAVVAVRNRILTVGLATGASMLLLFMVVSRVAIRPVQDLAAHARAVRDGKKVALPELKVREIRELGEAFEEMREALEGKHYVEKYVQTLTHELKSPLCAIQGAVELLDEDMPPARRRQFLGNIRSETGRITALVEKMLLLTSLEKQNEVRELQAVEVEQLARGVCADMAPAFEARRVQWDVASAGPVTIQGDGFLLRHALVNLLQNALDFSTAGGLVRVVITADEGMARLCVEDSGPGIPEYALPRVFERFYSLERPDTGNRSSGLGLPLVKEVAALHRGQVSLVNRTEGGAKAEITLPCDRGFEE